MYTKEQTVIIKEETGKTGVNKPNENQVDIKIEHNQNTTA